MYAPMGSSRSVHPVAVVALALANVLSPDISRDADARGDLVFDNRADEALVPQDVFVERPGAPADLVFRSLPVEAEHPERLAQAVYASAERTVPDPYRLGPAPFGPFPRGRALGFALGDWIGASGTGAYAVKDGRGELAVTFADLRPHGLYSLWCSPASRSFANALYPCSSDPSFEADASGHAARRLEMAPRLSHAAMSNNFRVWLVFHSDGRVRSPWDGVRARVTGPHPALGRDCHIQLWAGTPRLPLLHPKPPRLGSIPILAIVMAIVSAWRFKRAVRAPRRRAP